MRPNFFYKLAWLMYAALCAGSLSCATLAEVQEAVNNTLKGDRSLNVIVCEAYRDHETWNVHDGSGHFWQDSSLSRILAMDCYPLCVVKMTEVHNVIFKDEKDATAFTGLVTRTSDKAARKGLSQRESEAQRKIMQRAPLDYKFAQAVRLFASSDRQRIFANFSSLFVESGSIILLVEDDDQYQLANKAVSFLLRSSKEVYQARALYIVRSAHLQEDIDKLIAERRGYIQDYQINKPLVAALKARLQGGRPKNVGEAIAAGSKNMRSEKDLGAFASPVADRRACANILMLAGVTSTEVDRSGVPTPLPKASSAAASTKIVSGAGKAPAEDESELSDAAYQTEDDIPGLPTRRAAKKQRTLP